jgi:pilus assembly protein CpaE
MHRIPRIAVAAFFDSSESAAVLERVVADRRMARVQATLHAGGIGAALDLYRRTASPELLIIESRAGLDELRAGLDELADACVAGTKLLLIGHTNDIAFYRELLRLGVSEYIVAPGDPLAIIGAIARLYEAAGAARLGRSLAFVGAKGGVGSSTIARNVASALARSCRCAVILADLDLPYGSAHDEFDVKGPPGMAQALEDRNRLDHVLLERLLTDCEDNLSLLAAPVSLEHAFDLGEDAFERVLDVAQSTVPFVVIDVPHVWTSWARKTLLAADEVVISAMPDLANLRNARNLLEQLRRARPNDAPPRLVLSQVGVPKRAEIEPARFAAALQVEPVACIPFDPASTSTAANRGKMIADVTSGRSSISKAIMTIAQAISGRTAVGGRRPRFALRHLWKR